MANPFLESARALKNDEFYTYYTDIEKELINYKEFLMNTNICCPCDTNESNFFKYFVNNAENYNLKSVCASSLTSGKYIYYCDSKKIEHINTSNGNILSNEMANFMKNYDIICTNPPFSILKEFIEILTSINKKFIIIANENVLINPRIFPYMMKEEYTTGYSQIKSFFTDKGEEKKFGNIIWLTNLPIKKKYHIFNLTKYYNQENYPFMDNYEAINVDKIKDIPLDYKEAMGVPITYLKNHNPNQFKILGYAGGTTKNSGQNYNIKYTPHPDDRGGNAIVKGTRKYGRVFIKNISEN